MSELDKEKGYLIIFKFLTDNIDLMVGANSAFSLTKINDYSYRLILYFYDHSSFFSREVLGDLERCSRELGFSPRLSSGFYEVVSQIQNPGDTFYWPSSFNLVKFKYFGRV